MLTISFVRFLLEVRVRHVLLDTLTEQVRNQLPSGALFLYYYSFPGSVPIPLQSTNPTQSRIPMPLFFPKRNPLPFKPKTSDALLFAWKSTHQVGNHVNPRAGGIKRPLTSAGYTAPDGSVRVAETFGAPLAALLDGPLGREEVSG